MDKKKIVSIILFTMGLIFCLGGGVLCKYKTTKEVTEVNINIKSSLGVYAKLYDTIGDGIGDTLILGEHKNITYQGTLINDYNYIDNTSLGADNVWKSDISTIQSVYIVEEIKPTTTDSWFYNAKKLKEVINSQKINMSKNTTMNQMFYNCEQLQELDVSKWDISMVTSLRNTFRGCLQLQKLDVSTWNTSSVVTMISTFHNSSKLQELDVSNWNTSNVENMTSLFNGLKLIKKLDVGRWDTSRVKFTNSMFYNCEQLQEIDVSNWNMSENTRMDYMFYNCNTLVKLDVSKFNTAKVNNMEFLFSNCYSIEELDVSNWNTSNVTNMRALFQYCYKIQKLNFSKWNTSKVENMAYMFECMLNIEELDLTNFSSEALNNINMMFSHWSNLSNSQLSGGKLKKIVFGEKFTTIKVEQMQDVFSFLTELKELDLFMWHTNSLKNARHFINNSGLHTVYVNKYFKAPINLLENGVLEGNVLIGGNGTIKQLYENDINNAYFQADGNDQVGLFTLKPEYHITYDLNGGTLNDKRIKYWEIDKDYILPTPKKEGHTFIGWTIGKNLYQKRGESYTHFGLTFTTNSDGSYQMTGTYTGTENWADIEDSTMSKRKILKPGTYTISVPDNTKFSFGIKGHYDESHWEQFFIMPGKATTFTITKPWKYHVFINRVQHGVSYNENIKIQLEEGSWATPYERYIEIPQKDVIIEGGSEGNRTYIANWEPISQSLNIDENLDVLEKSDINKEECNE